MLQFDAPCALLAQRSLTGTRDLRLRTIPALRAMHDERKLKKSVTSKEVLEIKSTRTSSTCFFLPFGVEGGATSSTSSPSASSSSSISTSTSSAAGETPETDPTRVDSLARPSFATSTCFLFASATAFAFASDAALSRIRVSHTSNRFSASPTSPTNSRARSRSFARACAAFASSCKPNVNGSVDLSIRTTYHQCAPSTHPRCLFLRLRLDILRYFPRQSNDSLRDRLPVGLELELDSGAGRANRRDCERQRHSREK